MTSDRHLWPILHVPMHGVCGSECSRFDDGIEALDFCSDRTFAPSADASRPEAEGLLWEDNHA
jgi:hypothetical protein